MIKYFNIFHYGETKECYLVDMDDMEKTKRIEPGTKVKRVQSADKMEDAVLKFDADSDEFYFDVSGKRDYDVQGTIGEL